MAKASGKRRSGTKGAVKRRQIREQAVKSVLDYLATPPDQRSPVDQRMLSPRCLRALRANGKPYTGINQFLLSMMMMSRPGDLLPHWMTYNQAQKLGGQVRQGEKGTPVFFIKRLERKDLKSREDAEGRPELHPEDGRPIYMYRQYTVFNAAQIDDLPHRYTAAALPSEPINTEQRNAHCEAVFDAIGAKIETMPGLPPPSPPHYRTVTDVIRMPEFGAFTDAACYYAVLCHESAHWTGAAHRLDRGLTGATSGAEYAREELVAEFGAIFMCQEMGLAGVPHEMHDDYLASWARLLTDRPTELFSAASKAQRAVDYLEQLAIANGLSTGLTLPSAVDQTATLELDDEAPEMTSAGPDEAAAPHAEEMSL